MDVVSRLTVYFEDPFWVGVYERETGGGLEAARVVFGAEPKDSEVYEFFLQNWGKLRFSPPLAGERKPPREESPKRVQRRARRTLEQSGVGTKAQQALQALREQAAAQSKADRKLRTEREKERQFALRRQKKKQKHRGR